MLCLSLNYTKTIKMSIKELKKKLGLSNKDIASLFDLTPGAYANSTAKRRYENALIKFYQIIKDRL